MQAHGLTIQLIRRGGRYFRVADPGWDNPLDGSYALRSGGRWNPPGSFPVVYLNATVDTARANVALRFEGRSYSPEDLDPEEAPTLVTTQVGPDDFVDVVTDEGCLAAGLPRTYPRENGTTIPHSRCQPIGQRA
jgi:RES domain-containing protein